MARKKHSMTVPDDKGMCRVELTGENGRRTVIEMNDYAVDLKSEPGLEMGRYANLHIRGRVTRFVDTPPPATKKAK